MSGLAHLIEGAKLSIKPEIRWYVILPLLINVLLVGALLVWGYSLISGWQTSLLDWLPSWLDWLTWLLEPLFYIVALVFLAYGFSTLANLVASPFNGLLAEAVEAYLDPNAEMPDSSFKGIVRSIPRAIGKELAKIMYYLPRLLLITIIGLIVPGVNLLLSLLLGAWMMALQYIDYPLDNHEKSFTEVKQFCGARKLTSLSFGGFVLLFTAIPIANLFIMPVAVCAATKLWVDAPAQIHRSQ